MGEVVGSAGHTYFYEISLVQKWKNIYFMTREEQEENIKRFIDVHF